jgi:tetratricopeptide (TPR) repeat protein
MRARAGGGPALRIAAVAAYALALLAKESALGLVLVILALDSVALDSAAPDRVAPGTVTLDPAGARRTSFASSARWLAPYALVAVAWGFAHQAIGRAGGPPMYVSPGAPATWPAQAGLLLPHFAAALLPGVAHAPDALPRAWPGMVPAAILSAAALAAAAALAWRRSAALVPLTLFLAPLLPLVAAALAGKALPSGERLVYLASAGAAWALAMAVERATARGAGRAALLAAGALSAWSAVEYVRLQPAWKDDASVYEAMRRSQPANPVGWIGTADATAQRGDRAGAEALLARAAALGPDVPARHLVGAALHYRYGEWPAVVIAADSALALSPGLADVRVLRATALVRLRRLEEAELETRELLRERPDDPQVLAVEGQRLLLAGDAAGAALRLESAVSGAPDDVASWYSLGVARAITGRAGEAQQAFERTVALDPRYYQGWLALARAAAQAGDSAAATAALARAETLPEAAEARMRAQPGAR